MNIYLHDIPLSEAQLRFQKALVKAGLWKTMDYEEIFVNENASGRVLFEPIWAKISSPHYHASAMDGYAVRSFETNDATQTSPALLKYDEQTVYVDTGDPLPLWADSVIPIELVEPLDHALEIAKDQRYPNQIRIRASVPPWKNVRPMGEDMVATQLVLPSGHQLRPVDLGAIAGCGHHQIRVVRRPKVAILPTGSELKEIGTEVGPGDIIEYNSVVLAAQINIWGGEATRFPITPDDVELITKQVLTAAKDHDLILLNAGSSAGSEDFSAKIIEDLGDLLVHGIAVRPGHPVIMGMIHSQDGQKTTPIIGVPGYPVSAALTGEIMVEPIIRHWLGLGEQSYPSVNAKLTRKLTSPAGDDDYVRVVVGKVGGKLLAAPLTRGAGVISSLVRADGIAVLPRGTQGLPAGADVQIRLYKTLAEIEKTILAIGSHDMTLDILAQYLKLQNRNLSSANAGSLGGLIALSRGEAHFAGSHLLDPNSGEYNVSYINRYLPNSKITLVNLVWRDQGLIVSKNNEKNINTLADLTRPDIQFVNRQRGAGTRVLLDYHLGKLGLDGTKINGYSQEEYTHLAVSAAVASGRADCGLGIAAAAAALDLRFIPLFKERYDLVIPEVYFTDLLLSPLLELLASTKFQNAVMALPGYDVSTMGQIMASL